MGKQISPSPPSNEYDIRTKDVVRSTKIYVSQQRLILVLGLIFGGIFFLIIAAVEPPFPSMSDPWGPATDYTFNIIAALMGIGALIFGIVLYVLGGEEQERY